MAQDDHPIFSIDIHPAGEKFARGGQGDDYGRVTVWTMVRCQTILSSIPPKTNRIAIKDKPGPQENGTTDHKASDSSDSQARGPPVNIIKE